MILGRKISISASIICPYVLTHFTRCFSSGKNDEPTDLSAPFHRSGACRSPLFWQDQPQLDSHQIEVVDSDTWRVSSLVHVSQLVEHERKLRVSGVKEKGSGVSNFRQCAEEDPDLDEIEDLRIRGKLFYKIDRGSREFEEYAFEFHRRKSSSNKNNGDPKSKENQNYDLVAKVQKPLKCKDGHQPNGKGRVKDNSFQSFVNEDRLIRTIKENYFVHTPNETDSCYTQKQQRNPTFNQLTGPYHEPFCLDIYVSKASVRACVVHRVTSKVVVVAHSISKDLKFELRSTKSATAAAAVGKVLAQRALADDIHDVIYTPRKGDKLEGKLQIVLQSIIDNGINVKVKLKQRNPSKASSKPSVGEQVSSHSMGS